ncbi:hypothetical protein ACFU76_04625 [Streptomyces sp. NPDC057539]|uniref:hypothetical protein n=1 Tax=Streptomyces sp. NPDC057539 TaxID=3346159 RepID=UPI0036BA4193
MSFIRRFTGFTQSEVDAQAPGAPTHCGQPMSHNGGEDGWECSGCGAAVMTVTEDEAVSDRNGRWGW